MNDKEYDFIVKEEDAYDYYDEETGYEVRIGSQHGKRRYIIGISM